MISDLAAGEAPRFARATRAKRAARPAGLDTWSAVGPSGNTPALNDDVLALTRKGDDLYVGGTFYNAGGPGEADNVARWHGGTWSGFGSNNPFGPNPVLAIAVHGDDLYVGGSFLDADGIANADRIAMWDGATGDWSALGSGLGSTVRAIAVDGSDVYVGGDFQNAGTIGEADYIAKWDGSWSALGSHSGDGALSGRVNAIAISGGIVYAGGLFTNAKGRQTADYIAKWDGSTWRAMGSDGLGEGALSDEVFALLVSGNDLYVGGNFEDAGGTATADFVARWNGSSWRALGSNGGDGALKARVYALAMAGTDLYVGGHFLDAAGIPEADRVARWDGSDWFALGQDGPGDGAIDDTVYALAVYEGDLYVGGVFTDAAGIGTADYLARWGIGPIHLPDGRVRLGTSGPFTGNDVHNTSGKNQQVTGSAARRATITYQIDIQNDSLTDADTFTVAATGAATADYTVKFLRGSTDITTEVVAGTYQTPSVQAGDSFRIQGAHQGAEQRAGRLAGDAQGDHHVERRRNEAGRGQGGRQAGIVHGAAAHGAGGHGAAARGSGRARPSATAIERAPAGRCAPPRARGCRSRGGGVSPARHAIGRGSPRAGLGASGDPRPVAASQPGPAGSSRLLPETMSWNASGRSSAIW